MRIRQTKERIKAPDIKELEDKISEAAYNSVTYKLKVITPIYGGGVKAGEPDMEMPIRASAIRGQLRYWWRFLKMNAPFEENRLEGEMLFKEERRIWGGMTDAPDENGSSKVFVTISNIENNEDPVKICKYEKKMRNGRVETDWRGIPKYKQPEFHAIENIRVPQYALFPGQGKPPSAIDYDSKKDKPHKIILPDIEFTLKISLSKSLDQQEIATVKRVFNWWVCFGGIGARTRRGLGSVEVLSSSDNSFSVLSEEDVEKYSCQLIKLPASNATNAWSIAVGELQKFRQGVGEGRNQKRDQNNNLVYYDRNNKVAAQGGSRWPEPDSIREIAGKYSKKKTKTENGEEKVICNKHEPVHSARISFPRAQFGLPIIFKFNQKDENCGDPQQSELRPVDSERMSSPLILKAMKVDNRYVSIALKLPDPEISTLMLKGFNNKPNGLTDVKEQEWNENGWNDWQKNWWNESKAKDVKPINDYKATNALDAFMNFFAKGGKD